jgi:predicted ATPase/DNA-binding SARP family transcriptional activator/Tfp pilus assembly protein PilF
MTAPVVPTLEIVLFGSFEMKVHGQSAPRFRSQAGQWLLALLILRRKREIDRSWLATTLWPDSAEEQALYNLRRNLTDLRHVLGPEAERLQSPKPRTLRFDLAGADCDLVAFEEALASGNDDALKTAVALYRGELLEGCDEDWIYPERSARQEAFLAALDELASRAQPKDAVHYLRRIIAADPLRESAYAHLMEALAECEDYPAVTQTFRDLRTFLYRELHSEPNPKTVAIYQRIQSEDRSLKSSASIKKSKEATPAPETQSALPSYLTALVGREKEKEEVIQCIRESRLVTLTGTGGVGKTRLAVGVAERLLDEFPDGVWFVDLTPLSDPALVPETIAGVLGLYEEVGRSWLDILRNSLKSRTLLLALDNCEHLIESCAQIAGDLLGAAPRLRILATSRQPLGVEGERVWRVPSLSLPPPTVSPAEPPTLLEYEAVRLFVSRAVWNEPGFTLTPQNAEAVATICRQLEGIPLALELAAARVRGLPVVELARRLTEDFSVLNSGNREGGTRQRTLRTMVDWSYNLLRPEEQILLRRLSVFSGGWRLDAAVTVCSGDSLSKEAITDLLFALVDRSLVVMEAGTGRYRLLETIRQYTLELLHQSQEERELRARHLEWCKTFVSDVETRRDAAQLPGWVELLDEEHDNLRAALANSLEPPAESESPEEADRRVTLGFQLALRLHRYWIARDIFSEGQTFLQAYLDRTGSVGAEESRLRAQAWRSVGQIAYSQGDYTQAIPAFREALSLYDSQGLGDEATITKGLLGVVQCHQGDFSGARTLLEDAYPLCGADHSFEGVLILDALAYAVREQGDYKQARSLLERAISMARKTGNAMGQANCLFNLGYVAYEEGDYAEANLRFNEAARLFAGISNRTGEARCLCSLGVVIHSQGDQNEAFDLVNRALQINLQIGHVMGQGWNYRELGEIRVSQGRCIEAQPYYEEALAIHREYDCLGDLANDMSGLAKVALYLGHYGKAHHWYRESLRLMESLGMKLGVVWVLEALADLYRMEGRAGPAVQLLSATPNLREEIGAAMNTFVREGRQLHLSELRAVLGDEAYEEYYVKGRTMSFREAVDFANSQQTISSLTEGLFQA